MKISKLLLFLLVHILFAPVLVQFPIVATIHAWLTLAIGLLLVLTTRDIRRVILVAAYVAGAELIWRMAGASVFWEFGKYATIAILGIGFLRQNSWKNVSLPIIYLGLLLISIPLTISWFGLNEDARQMISFHLSGPLSLAVCVLFFLQVEVGSQDFEPIAWTIAMPVASILAIAVYSTLTASNITFVGASNFTTSGGFGPNQVSAILGLGGVMMFMVAVVEKGGLKRGMAIILLLAFLIQSLLTFSRGGIYNAGICILFAALQLYRSGHARKSIFFASILLFSFAYFIAFPKLNDFTNGQFERRFSDLDTTNRKEIAMGELDVWFENFIFGVGPGISTYKVTDILYIYAGNYAGAHTEYTRLLAEHGIFGFFALLLLIIMAFRSYFKAKEWAHKVWVVVLILWPLMEMSHAAMRIVATSFLFGLAMVNWDGRSSTSDLSRNEAVTR